MPIEIRELIIKTEIFSGQKSNGQEISMKDLEHLKMQLLEECKRIIAVKTQHKNYKR
ncbi:hypothetical protein G6M26_21010 [Agrobacterium tumefaciens]|nr:hypothetical protein [Agrobacterium tumefaciens]NTE21019.1 hypothetical protein [Agrobacterium tumefaciens]